MAKDLWIFAGLMVLGQFSPGPDLLLITRTSLSEGRSAGWMMAFGIACGLMVHATVALAGLAILLQRMPVMMTALQWLAALYLLWLAFGLLKHAASPGSIADGENSGRTGLKSAWVRGLLCNLFNPKVAVFLASVCTPFLTGSPPPGRAPVLWAMIVGMGFSLWCLWVWVLQWNFVRKVHQSASRWIDVCFGVALVLLALRLMIP